ncbi:MAG: formimidoylglutamate deiminase [Rhizobiaceae bacterium]
MRIFGRHALLPEGWRKDVAVTIEYGRIASVVAGSTPHRDDIHVPNLLPALSNLHSHTFQRGMAGMTETRGASRDSFWTWREMMYRFIDHLTPQDIEAIAAMAFVEMQESGFAAVAEFHYVHHQPGGVPYADPAELSARIFAAAVQTGIGITHLPVLYTFGGAGETPLAGGQLRFGNNFSSYEKLHAAVVTAAKTMPQDSLAGCAPHSLRAVNPEILQQAVNAFGDLPLHIHIAEQTKEIEDIEAWLGARPVEWLLANATIGPNWCLIHATHMSEAETRNAAKTGAVAGLCPVTEANLGDGIFNGRDWIAGGGKLGIGSDSNVRISAPLELATLEYSQRLRHRERNVMIDGEGSTGMSLYRRALIGGAQALGRDSGAIKTGKWADLMALDNEHPALCGLAVDQLLDGYIFAAPDGVVSDLWSAGRHCVKDRRHVARDAVANAYRATMHSLQSRF